METSDMFLFIKWDWKKFGFYIFFGWDKIYLQFWRCLDFLQKLCVVLPIGPRLFFIPIFFSIYFIAKRSMHHPKPIKPPTLRAKFQTKKKCVPDGHPYLDGGGYPVIWGLFHNP